MAFVIVGTVLVLLKWFDIDPVAGWSWLWVLSPFGLAVAWWVYADSTGLTQRRAIRRLEERKQKRRERDMVALGLNVQSDRRARAQREAAEEVKQKQAGGKAE